MLWLNPIALVALAAVAAPILIHILVQRRAESIAFPTLRFLVPTPLAAIRRHLLEDGRLLAVRAAILAAAAAAVAAPLVMTALRRQQWDRRIVRAMAIDPAVDSAGDAAMAGAATVYRAEQFTGTSLRDAVQRAGAWLETAPPARLELVVVSPLAIGSIDAAVVDSIPDAIGIRFDRRGELPRARTVAAGDVIAGSHVLAREVTFAGRQTVVRDVPASEPPTWPIDVVHDIDAKPAVDAARDAVLAQRIPSPASRRRVRLVIGERLARSAIESATTMSEPWMADAAARLARDPDLRAAAARVAG